jgi:hypothetical protein
MGSGNKRDRRKRRNTDGKNSSEEKRRSIANADHSKDNENFT